MSIDPYAIEVPEKGAHIHLIGICGTGMSAFARILLDAGYLVSGCDLRADPPTGPALVDWGIDIHIGYTFEALNHRPDLVVVGNAVTSANEVALAALERRIPVTHMPALLNKIIPEDRPRIVVAGSHGKSTTSAIVAWILKESGCDPGWLIGATPLFGPSGVFGSGPFVMEGDEYNAAYFDRGAKFFHYRPTALGITTVEFDHADLYKNLADVEKAFTKLIASLRADDYLVLAEDAQRFATSTSDQMEEPDFKLLDSNRTGVRFQLKGELFEFPLPGRHSAVDAAIAACLTHHVGVLWPDIRTALATYPGIRLRQEILLDEPIRVIRDFGHHPTEIKATLAGLRDAWPDRQITAVFEPRSYTSRTNLLRSGYENAFESADRVFFAPVYMPARLQDDALDTFELARFIGCKATAFTDFATLEQMLENELKEGVIIFFSNGTMDNLPQRFADQAGS